MCRSLDNFYQQDLLEKKRNLSLLLGIAFHGLRTTVSVKLAEAGADTQTIMAVTGHQTESMMKKYTEEAKRRKNAKAGIRLLEQ